LATAGLVDLAFPVSFRDILRPQLRTDESVQTSAYQDSEGFWTIGVGRLIDARRGGRLRPDEIALMLENDINDAEADARALVPNFDKLSPARQAVICNMAFNLGRGGLATFKATLRAIAEERWADAARGMLASTWASQVKGRAVRLAEQMRKG
jgi:lysozyme